MDSGIFFLNFNYKLNDFGARYSRFKLLAERRVPRPRLFWDDKMKNRHGLIATSETGGPMLPIDFSFFSYLSNCLRNRRSRSTVTSDRFRVAYIVNFRKRYWKIHKKKMNKQCTVDRKIRVFKGTARQKKYPNEPV